MSTSLYSWFLPIALLMAGAGLLCFQPRRRSTRLAGLAAIAAAVAVTGWLAWRPAAPATPVAVVHFDQGDPAVPSELKDLLHTVDSLEEANEQAPQPAAIQAAYQRASTQLDNPAVEHWIDRLENP